MSDQRQPDPRLLAAALSDRDRRPWRYYRIEYGELKKFTEREADRADRAEAERDAAREALMRLRGILLDVGVRGLSAVIDDSLVIVNQALAGTKGGE